MRILDIGSGILQHQNLLQRTSNEVIGIDLSEEIIDTAKQRYPSFTFLRMDAEKLEFEDGTFDQVFAIDVLEHVDNLPQVLSEVKRVLKPGGKLVINVPAEKSEYWLLKLRPTYFQEIHHVRIFKDHDLQNLLADYNFKLISEQKKDFLEHAQLYFLFKYTKKGDTQLGIGNWKENWITQLSFIFLTFFNQTVFETPLKYIPIWLITIPIGRAIDFVGNRYFPKSMFYVFQKS